MERMPAAAGHHVHDIQIAGRARVQFGDQYHSGGLTINSKVAPLTDYTGRYAHNALAPVSTYVDRPELRGKLEEQFHNCIDSVHHKTPTVVVYGIGGVGKTQLVLDYIQRYRQDYSAVFWIEAGSPETIQRDYVQIYVLLHSIPLEGEQDAIQVQYAVPAVKRWFYGRGKKWLFIFDNADSISNQNDPLYVDLRCFLPDDPCVHVIITTRDRLATEMTELPAVEVDEMRLEEASTLFRRQARIYTTSLQQEEQITAIVQELGRLALAVTLAGSYVAATPRLRADLTRYLPEYRERRKELLAQRPSWLVHQYGESLLTTWETTFRAMEGQSPEACRFLVLLSFLNQDDIPADFPTTWINNEPPAWISAIFSKTQINQYDIEEFFRVLVRFSFIKYREDQGSYSMHNLIQAWAYDRLEKNQQRHYRYVCALLLQVVINTTENVKPVIRGRFVPHVVSSFHKISRCVESASPKDELVIDLLERSAHFLNLCGQPKDEVVFRRFILRKQQSWYGPDHSETLRSMSNLAATLRQAGKLQEALSMQRVVLKKHQQMLGEDHPNTLVSMSNLASMLKDVGELQEALFIHCVVLKKHQQILGEDHPNTLISMSNLASMLKDVGELQEALSIHCVVLEKRQQILGEDHPDTLASMNNLATTLSDVGELQEALLTKRAVLKKYQQILGEDHPDTLASMNNLATTLSDVGELQEALPMQRKAVEKMIEVLGAEHPDTILLRRNLQDMEESIEKTE
ncbi:hypothetical protein H2198_001692 [Neophaeococcomyces mojaviensis]|uniref:Uncharacterized protein n=1 Tax=Neophaeococcomyces mojaviensis TaxID=3383035 RepID=A0ACC3AH05_9EURO|nr:hypothetical protein H2198_001692 [Knufia sp. JES_112]